MTFRHFTRKEFDCQQTGENDMQDEFIHSLDTLRHECGFSFRITSGYRSPSHSIEARKAKPGTSCPRYCCGHRHYGWVRALHHSQECYGDGVQWHRHTQDFRTCGYPYHYSRGLDVLDPSPRQQLGCLIVHPCIVLIHCCVIAASTLRCFAG